MALYDKVESGDELCGPALHIFVLWMWNIEMQNGGLCQFFVNDGQFASLVPPALEAVGAKEYATLLNSFISQHKIDLQNLSQFHMSIDSMDADLSAYTEATEIYPFDEFDNGYYDLYGSASLSPIWPHISVITSTALSENNTNPRKHRKNKRFRGFSIDKTRLTRYS